MMNYLLIGLVALVTSACTTIHGKLSYNMGSNNQQEQTLNEGKVTGSVDIQDTSFFRKDEKTLLFLNGLNEIQLRNSSALKTLEKGVQ